MSRQQPLAYRQWLAQFRGGTMYIFGCHLIDLVVSMLGKPDRITSYQRQTDSNVRLYDNGLAVLEYPKTTATIRTASSRCRRCVAIPRSDPAVPTLCTKALTFPCVCSQISFPI